MKIQQVIVLKKLRPCSLLSQSINLSSALSQLQFSLPHADGYAPVATGHNARWDHDACRDGWTSEDDERVLFSGTQENARVMHLDLKSAGVFGQIFLNCPRYIRYFCMWQISENRCGTTVAACIFFVNAIHDKNRQFSTKRLSVLFQVAGCTLQPLLKNSC